MLKNVAGQSVDFYATDAAGAPLTGLAVTAKVRKDGGAFAASSNAVSEVGFGVYSLTPTQGETDAEKATFLPTAAGALIDMQVHYPVDGTFEELKGTGFVIGRDDLVAIRAAVAEVVKVVGKTEVQYATAGVRVIGDDDGGDYTDTVTPGTYMVTGEDAGAGLRNDFTFVASDPDFEPQKVSMRGRYEGGGLHYCEVWAFNYNPLINDYELRSTASEHIPNTNFDDLYEFALGGEHHDPNTGEAKISFRHNATSYNATHALHIEQLGVSFGEIGIIPTPSDNAFAVVNEIIENNGEGTEWTLKEALRLLLAFMVGERAGGGDTGAGVKTFKVPGGAKTRISMNTDEDGNSLATHALDDTDA
jgi:hypothetical protein